MFYVGIIIISLVGALLHFLYEFSHHNEMMAVFAAVNESTWEHIKIGITATIIWSLYDGFVYGVDGNYLIGKAMCILTIILLIPILFYTYTAFTKKAILLIDIICFCITIYCSQYVFYHYIDIQQLPFIYTYFGTMLLFFEISAYLTLTYKPFKNFLFKDPITNEYGLEGHPCHHHHKGHKHLLIILICLVLLSGCIKNKKDISKIIEVDIKKCSFERESGHSDNDIYEYYAELDCSKFDSDKLTSNWKSLPLTNEIGTAMLETKEKYSIPEVENGYYFFIDRYNKEENKYNSFSLNDREHYDFSLAIYDTNNKMLYYYELEK